MRERQQIEIVSIADPALDRKEMDVAKYAGTSREPGSRDPSLIRLLPGKAAVRFQLRELTRRQYDQVERTDTVSAKNAAIAFGLRGVVVPGRETLRPAREVGAENGGSFQIWDEEQLDDLQDIFGRKGRDVLREIATVILSLSDESGNVWGGSEGPLFSLPPSLWLALEPTPAPRAKSSAA
jgi:hypothetical protein